MSDELLILSTEHEFMGKPRMCARCSAPDDGSVLICPLSTAACFESHNFTFETGKWGKCRVCQVSRSLGYRFLCNNMVPSGSMVLEDEVRIQLVVTHNNENITYHSLNNGTSWRIDAGLQHLIIGKGIGRVMLPLCNILYYSLEKYYPKN